MGQKNLNLLPFIGFSYFPFPGVSLDPNTYSVIADYINDNAEALQTLHQILNFNQSRMPIDYSMGAKALFSSFDINIASQTLLLESLIHLEDRSPDLAVPCIVSTFKIARFCHQEFQIDQYVTGVISADLGILNLEYTLNRYPLNRVQLDEISSALTDLQSTPGLSHALIGDRCLMSDDINLRNWHVLSFFDDRIEMYAPFLDFLGFIDDDHLLFLEYKERSEAALKLPFEQRLKVAQSIKKEISELSDFHLLIKSVYSPFSHEVKYFEFDLRHHTRINLVRTVLALEHYRLDHEDRLPETLTDLIPDYLDTIPIDPFDGLPVKYQKTHPGCLIYSVGPDLTDNGGILTDTNGERFTPGTDIPFTVKRK